ncbi:MAG TPA: site-specific integrase, partial [Candidatus Latescibacteria bacterium]|nr:site-specific integrase [Candidatus Latescibacterota bacterium]
MRAGRDFPTPESNRHTVAELIGKYIANALPRKRLSTSRNQASQLEWWRERLGHYLLQELRPALLADAREGLSREPTPSGKPRSPSTVNRYMAAMSHCLTYAVRDLNWLDDNPMRKVSRNKEPQGVVRYLSDQERSRLLSVCKQSSSSFLYPIVLLALSTGMRRSEIMNLTWDRIDFLRDAITLRSADTKNAEVRIVPLKSHARGALAELWKDRLSDSALVFPAPTAPEG